MKKIIKRIVITVLVIALIIGALFAVYKVNQSKKTAQVISAANYAMDSYWGDAIESYGTVSSDKSQTVVLSSTEKVSEVNVKEGDTVKEGDVLLTVESEEVDVKGKSLELQQEQIKLDAAKRELAKLQATTPVPDAEDVQSVDESTYRTYVSSKVYKCKTDGYPNAKFQAGEIVAEETLDSSGNQTCIIYYDGSGDASTKGNQISEAAYLALDGSPIKATADTNHDYYEVTEEKSKIVSHTITSYYNAKTGKLLGTDEVDESGNQLQTYDTTGKYTASELSEAIADEQKTVKELDLSVRKKTLELDQLKETAGNGTITAKISGTVTKVQDVNNINYNSAFLAISGTDEYYISGTIGEFYLDTVKVGDTCTVTSWESGNMVDATITEIETYPSTGDGGYSGSGNSNSSSYPFKASFDIDSGIELGDAVDIQISSGDSESGFYMYTAFIRKDKSGSYIMRMNDENRLEKVYVTTGKSLYGSYTEITSGNVTMDDYLAFPYGNGAIEGANCEIADSLE